MHFASILSAVSFLTVFGIMLLGIVIDNGRFTAIASRLMNLENKTCYLAKRVTRLEGMLGRK